MIYIGIDPGPEESAVVSLDDTGVVYYAKDEKNADVVNVIGSTAHPVESILFAIEDFTPYGKSLGHESLETIKWIGEFRRACKDRRLYRLSVQYVEIPRPEIKQHLCDCRTAKDADVRDALIHRYGPGKERAVGTKKAPGPLYGLKSHHWAALAVAVTAMDRNLQEDGS